jgi:hypothetical protein
MDFNRRALSSLVIGGSALSLLSACAKGEAAVAAVEADVNKVVATLTVSTAQVTNDYAIVKGIGEIGLTALALAGPDGAVASAAITAAFKIADAAVANLPALSSSVIGLADAVSTILSQSFIILANAAPKITAVANA